MSEWWAGMKLAIEAVTVNEVRVDESPANAQAGLRLMTVIATIGGHGVWAKSAFIGQDDERLALENCACALRILAEEALVSGAEQLSTQ